MKLFDKALCEIKEMTQLENGIFNMILSAPEIAKQAKIGQFAHIYIPGHTLRRPISICQSNTEKGTIRLVFQIRGNGTEILAKLKKGDILDVLGPLGKGFPLSAEKKKVLLVGGGIGVPPLLGIAEYYGASSTACLGFRSKENVILADDFKRYGVNVLIATEDGSMGNKGFVSDLFQELTEADCIYACGPQAMLLAVCEFARKSSIPCFISLEERMACGVGACLGCACELLDKNGNTFYGHVCKDGPVFDYTVVSSFATINQTSEV